jgi:hypothetical protein
MGISRTTASRWWGRYQQLGQAGLVDRPSIPPHSPRRTAARVEQRILRLRRRERLGPARIAARLGLPASTVHRVLVRHGCNRLANLDRPTGRPIRRYEHLHPGDLVHLDTKKLGRIPVGGGHRLHGRAAGWPTVAPTGVQAATTTCTPPAVDDHSHLAYVEVLDDERAQTCARFWRRAHRWFALHGITVVRVLTDNGVGYRSACSGPHWPTTTSATSAPGLIGRRPMERSSGSTGPCWRNGRSNAARRAGRSWSGWRRRPSRPEPLGTLARTLRRKWDPAELDRGAGHGGLDDLAQPEVGVGDD